MKAGSGNDELRDLCLLCYKGKFFFAVSQQFKGEAGSWNALEGEKMGAGSKLRSDATGLKLRIGTFG